MHIVYANETIPESYTKSLFLAGPTPRSSSVKSWRPEALKFLKRAKYDGVVFIPEPRDGRWSDYDTQIEWEEKCLHLADCILFWVPRELETMPALTTNIEFGVWQDSGKVVFGAPSTAVKNNYLWHYVYKLQIPAATTLPDTIQHALTMLGNGALRTGGEREVPLYIWRTLHFQNWYKTLLHAGNRLDGARIVWTFRVGENRGFVFFWALHVNVYITEESRYKTNEVVLARPDISTIVMYYPSKDIMNSDIVLIREFRSPVNNIDGYVFEIPGGSSFKPKGNPLILAADECNEETGLYIDASRMKQHESRQLVATLSAHKAHLFSVVLTIEEVEYLCSIEGIPHGVEEDTERTYVHVCKLHEILQCDVVDWSMVGMIFSVLLQK